MAARRPTRREPASPRVLALLHEARSSAGRLGRMLAARGYEIEVRRPRAGEPLPQDVTGYAAVAVFGGSMSANDDDPAMRAEIDWLGRPLAAGVPLLGICLGAQMLVRQLGGKVGRHPSGTPEIGFHPIEPTAAGAALLRWPAAVYQWHDEGFDMRPGATLLAGGRLFPHQAIRYGTATFGVQFHPEMTLAMLHRWTSEGAHRLLDAGVQSREAQIAARRTHDAAVKRWLGAFIELWLDAGRPGARTGSQA